MRVKRVVTADVEAYKLTLLGRHYSNRLTEEGVRKGIECFDQAITRDAAYVPAHLGRGLAYACLSLGDFSVRGGAFRHQAERALGRALELDSSLAEAMASNAMLLMQYDYAWERAEAMLLRAIEVGPNCASAHDVYGNFLAAPLAASGARDEALAVLARCEEARATKNIWLVALAMAYAQLGAIDLALTRLEEAYEARDFWMVWLKVQPEFDPLRAEPRFQRLLRKYTWSDRAFQIVLARSLRLQIQERCNRGLLQTDVGSVSSLFLLNHLSKPA